MDDNRGLRRIALILSLAIVLPAYFLGFFLTDEIIKRETLEYKVWQQSYVVDQQMYEAIAKNPPPRYQHPQLWMLRSGGAGFALTMFIVVYLASRSLIRTDNAKDLPERMEDGP